MYDLFFMRIPNKVVLTGVFVWLPYMYFSGRMSIVGMALLTMVLCFSALYSMYLARAIGAGDVKLIVMLCGYLNFSLSVRFFAAIFIFAAICGVIKIFRVYYGAGNIRRIRIKMATPIFMAYIYLLIKGVVL